MPFTSARSPEPCFQHGTFSRLLATHPPWELLSRGHASGLSGQAWTHPGACMLPAVAGQQVARQEICPPHPAAATQHDPPPQQLKQKNMCCYAHAPASSSLLFLGASHIATHIPCIRVRFTDLGSQCFETRTDSTPIPDIKSSTITRQKSRQEARQVDTTVPGGHSR